MSKELAEQLDLPPVSDDTRKQLEDTMRDNTGLQSDIDERMAAVRSGDTVATQVHSWRELWRDY